MRVSYETITKEISTHALREEGDQTGYFVRYPGSISTHALREEGDLYGNEFEFRPQCNFYPRPPRGGRRQLLFRCHWGGVHFYPRPPRGGQRR